MQHGTGREREALVGDLLGDDVLEAVLLVGLPVERDEVDGAQGAEILTHGIRRAELRIDAAERRRLERPPDDARHLDRAAGRLAERVDAAEDQGCAGSPAPARARSDASSRRSTPSPRT